MKKFIVVLLIFCTYSCEYLDESCYCRGQITALETGKPVGNVEMEVAVKHKHNCGFFGCQISYEFVKSVKSDENGLFGIDFNNCDLKEQYVLNLSHAENHEFLEYTLPPSKDIRGETLEIRLFRLDTLQIIYVDDDPSTKEVVIYKIARDSSDLNPRFYHTKYGVNPSYDKKIVREGIDLYLGYKINGKPYGPLILNAERLRQNKNVYIRQ